MGTTTQKTGKWEGDNIEKNDSQSIVGKLKSFLQTQFIPDSPKGSRADMSI